MEADPIEVEHPALWGTLRIAARILSALYFDFKVWGIHHVPREGGALLVSNHQSFLDPVLLAVALSRPVSFFAKAELFKNRYFGWFIRQLNAFPVRRGEGDISALKEAVKRLREGRILTFFPEGTRSPDGQLGPILPGISMLIRRAGVPIIPAIIDGSGASWSRKRKYPRPHPVRVMYGPPLAVEGLKNEAVTQLVQQTLQSMLAEVRRRSVAQHPL